MTNEKRQCQRCKKEFDIKDLLVKPDSLYPHLTYLICYSCEEQVNPKPKPTIEEVKIGLKKQLEKDKKEELLESIERLLTSMLIQQEISTQKLSSILEYFEANSPKKVSRTKEGKK
jgi:hypothetical protein